MYIIVGLGNPGKQYENTRHNIGFMTIDSIAEKHQIPVIEIKHKAQIGKGYIGGEKVILAKPLTFMNLSGESVRALTDYYKVDTDTNLIVIYDDISMDVGQLRIRKKGSAGGHNGIKSIIAHLNSDVFQRIKMGVGDKKPGYDLADYVLGHFDKSERDTINQSIQDAVAAVETIMSEGADAAMNRYNKKAEKKS
ncbi:MAG: aminoacyl-tRNA hydrolase [Lachnospiraceae bacterium]|nr:aminoacyl-tRNA hydrolase [Lachnospiraceae bacterium]